jgi:hypothetical protein
LLLTHLNDGEFAVTISSAGTYDFIQTARQCIEPYAKNWSAYCVNFADEFPVRMQQSRWFAISAFVIVNLIVIKADQLVCRYISSKLEYKPYKDMTQEERDLRKLPLIPFLALPFILNYAAYKVVQPPLSTWTLIAIGVGSAVIVL